MTKLLYGRLGEDYDNVRMKSQNTRNTKMLYVQAADPEVQLTQQLA